MLYIIISFELIYQISPFLRSSISPSRLSSSRFFNYSKCYRVSVDWFCFPLFLHWSPNLAVSQNVALFGESVFINVIQLKWDP